MKAFQHHRFGSWLQIRSLILAVLVLLGSGLLRDAFGEETSRWRIGKPIVTYWAGPPLTETVAAQLAEGGWNVVWATEKDLDTAAKFGLRAQLQDPLLSPESLDDPERRSKLDALIDRVRNHPALYSYFLRDEPNARDFPALGRLVEYLRQRDPAHLAYINLFPTYATNEQLGTKGDVVTAYREHLRLYLETVKPDLISYDHYQFRANDDSDQYFLNLSLIREFALASKLPFLNIVQACSWTPSMRVPNGDELRYLVYTTLAYGAQGISYYVYCWPNHVGGMAGPDGTPTPLYHTAKVLNREFAAIAEQLQPLSSLGVYHVGSLPPGAVALSAEAPFRITGKGDSSPGFVLGYFGQKGGPATHVVVVNLNYRSPVTGVITAPGPVEQFDPGQNRWQPLSGSPVQLDFPPGGGFLLRIR